MWDTQHTTSLHLSHDIPCPACGHGRHSYLPCSTECLCPAQPIPGYYEDYADAGRGLVGALVEAA